MLNILIWSSPTSLLATYSSVGNVLMTHCCSTFRLPHAFYPVQTEGYIEIGPGDKLAARCIMVNDQDHVITTGPKDTDEMCIFYVMFYVESKNEPLLSQVLHSTNLQFGDISKLNHF